MRTATLAELTRLSAQAFNIYSRVELEDQTGAWRDVTSWNGGNYFVSAQWAEMLDEPVRTGTITLHRQIGVYSIAPTMTTSPLNIVGGSYSPFIRGGQKVRVSTAVTDAGVAPVSGDWKEVFLGKVDNPDWGGKPNQLSLAISDEGGWLAQTQVQDVRTYSTDVGVPVETIMQQILDDWQSSKLGPVTLYVPTSPGWNIKSYQQQQTNVLDAIRTLAQQIGWDVRFKYDASNVFRLTFYQPDRAKTTVDYTFDPSRYLDLTPVKLNTDDIRNVVRVKFVDGTTGAIGSSVATDAVSIAKYDTRFMELSFDSTSNIDTQSEADSLSSAVLSDLSNPLVDQTMRHRYFWIAELGDLYAFNANAQHYDVQEKLAVVGIQHSLARDKRETTLQVRGVPAGAYKDWLVKSGAGAGDSPVSADSLDFVNFREQGRDANGVTETWDGVTPGVTQIWVYELTLPNPINPATDPYKTQVALVTPVRYDATSTTSLTFKYPPLNSTKYIQIELRDAALDAGMVHRVTLQAAGSKPQIINVQQSQVSPSFCAVSLDVTDALLKGGTLRAWVNASSANDADPTTTPDTCVVAGTPSHFDATTTFSLSAGGTATLLSNVQVHQGRGKRVFFEFVNTDGTSSGVQSFTLLSTGGIIDANGTLLDASINAASQFAASVQPVQVFASTLPATAPDGTFAFLVSDGKLYRRTGGQWVASVAAPDITGQIVTTQIADAALTTAKFAASIRPVELLSTTTGTPGINRIAFNTTDGKLYRSTADGSAWTPAVAAVDVSGQLVASQLVDGIISTVKFAAGLRPVRIVSALPGSGDLQGDTVFLTTDNQLYRWTGTTWTTAVPASVLTGQINTAQIADAAITAAKIGAAAVQTSNIASAAITAALIAAGAVVTAAIASAAVTTAQLASSAVTNAIIAAGAVTTTSISDGSITTPKIVAGAITAAVIAAGTITATQIAAATITGANIAAATIAAGNIVAGTITATQIAAATITGANIAAVTITAANIAAGTITATQIAAATITAGNIAASTITGGNIAANTIAGTNIIAGTITTSLIAANAITTGLVAAGAITASQIAAQAVTATKLYIGDFNNLVEDPSFENGGSTYTLGASWSIVNDNTKARTGNFSIARAGNAAASVAANALKVNAAAGDQFYAECYVNGVGTPDGGAHVRISWRDVSDAEIGTSDGNVVSPATYTKSSVLATAPASTVFARIQARATNTVGTYYVDDLLMRRAVTGALVVDGSITGSDIAAATITATNIVAGTITSNELAANSIISGKIAAGAVSTTELAASAVTAAKIAAGTITATQIAAATITGAVIAGATITATNIAAATITSSQIAANTIVAGNIAAGAITATAIASGAVTASKISVSVISGISSDLGTIVAGKLNSTNGQSYIDLNATGTNPFVHHADSLGNTTIELLANGSATFYGTVASTSFTGTTATFSGGNVQVSGGFLFISTTYGIIFGISSGPFANSDGTTLFLGGSHNSGVGTVSGGVKRLIGGATGPKAPIPVVVISSSAPSSPGNYLDGDLWCQV